MATRSDRLKSILADLRSSSPDIVGAAVVSIDGFVMASVLPSESQEEVIAAMGAALLGIAERIGRELLEADMQQVFVKTKNGYVVLNAAGEESLLVTLTSPRAKLGLVFLDAGRAAGSVAEIV